MGNDSLSWIFPQLNTQLAGIPDYIWGIVGLVGIFVTIYLGYTYVNKINRRNKIELDQAKQDIINANAQSAAKSTAKIERCINQLVSSQDRQANPFCREIAEDARRLQNSASNYDRGLSKAALGDLDGAEAEFNTAIDLHLPVLSQYYFQRGNIKFLQKKFKNACTDYSAAISINLKIKQPGTTKALLSMVRANTMRPSKHMIKPSRLIHNLLMPGATKALLS